jgi:hypothetical protein
MKPPRLDPTPATDTGLEAGLRLAPTEYCGRQTMGGSRTRATGRGAIEELAGGQGKEGDGNNR